MQAELRREYFVGLDLGLRRDPSAVVVLERLPRDTGVYDRVLRCQVMETVFVVREARRFPLEMPYVEIPVEVRRVIRGLREGVTKKLMVDATGVGAPVVELLKKADLGVELKPVVITGGETVGRLPHAETVPRRVLLENLRILLETRAVRLPAGLAGLGDLRRELLGFGRRGSRERDDLVFAMALAGWPVRPQGSFGFMPNRMV
ncbi:MAG: hypothetical protein IPP47_09755 [Bryobacterales bacterium]|nr:hypothetical protein [Bryobacterales bacterium]